MSVRPELVRAIEANIYALRRPIHCGYPEGQARCDLVADDLEEALRLYAYLSLPNWVLATEGADY